jgi:ATP-dependent RNA helicase DeaD
MTNTKKTEASFSDFNLSPEIMKALADLKFEVPTPIQLMTIPKLMAEGSKDLIGLASTGTGKTAAFAIPALERIDGDDKSIQVLVMSPTRELAQQVGREFELLAKYTNKRVVVINGGASYIKQKSELRRGVQICVATPGRLIDLIDQGILVLSKVHTVVLDEADEMISMGFREHIEKILEQIPSKQTWLFSATMDQQIRRVAQKYLTTPHMVQLNTDQGLSPLIESFYFLVKNENKVTALQRLLLKNPDFYGLIFCQTKAEVADVEGELRARGLAIESLHGDKKQSEREVVLRKLKERQISAVVATDVAARGLDVKDLTHVVNYNLPWEAESFVHRSGRTGRNGQKGTTWSFISPSQQQQLRNFQKQLGFQWTKGTIPSLTESLSERIQSNVQNFVTQAQEESVQYKLDKFFERVQASPMMETLLALEPKQLIRAFFLQAFPEILERDYAVEYEPRPQTDRFSSRPSEGGRGGRGGDYGRSRRDGPTREYGPRRDGPSREYGPRREGSAPRAEGGYRRDSGAAPRATPPRGEAPRFEGGGSRRDSSRFEEAPSTPRDSERRSRPIPTASAGTEGRRRLTPSSKQSFTRSTTAPRAKEETRKRF